MNPLAYFLVLLLAGRSFAVDSGAQRLFKQAQQSAENHRYVEAMGGFLKVLEVDPGHEKAKQHLWVVTKLLAEQRAEKSATDAQRRLWSEEVRFRLSERRVRLGRLINELNRTYEKSRRDKRPESLLAATEAMEGILQKEPELLEVEAVKAQGELQNILDGLERAAARRGFTDPKDLLKAQGYLAYFKGDWGEALELWSRAAEGGGDLRLQEIMSRVRRDFNRRKKREYSQRLSEQAEAFSKSGLYNDALDALEELRKLDPAYPGLDRRLREAREGQSFKDSQQKVRKLISDGIGLFKSGDYMEAAQIWVEALGLDPKNEEARYWLKVAGRRLKSEPRRSVQGKAPLQSAPKITAPAPAASAEDGQRLREMYRQGLILYSEGRVDEARETFEAILKMDSGHVQARRALERISGEFESP